MLTFVFYNSISFRPSSQQLIWQRISFGKTSTGVLPGNSSSSAISRVFIPVNFTLKYIQINQWIDKENAVIYIASAYSSKISWNGWLHQYTDS